MDLFGPVAYISIGGNKYGLVIVDDYSRFTWVFFLQDKSEVQGIVKKFIKRAQNEFEVKIKNIRSDNGTEFKNTNIEEFLDSEGIKHEFSAPYTPQQNGIVERKNRTLIEAAKTMLDEYKTSDQFWAEAINTACHAINRLYLHKILGKTAYELLTGNKPKVHYFRVFGCKCFILNKKPKSSKFAPKVDEGFFLGYGTNEHAYRVFNKTTGCVETMKFDKTVKFDESNGSQVEQVNSNLVEEEEPPSEAIMRMAIGEIRPRENPLQVQGEASSSTRVEPPSENQGQDHGDDHAEDQDQKINEETGDQVNSNENEDDDDGQPIQRQSQVAHPRVHQSIQRDHPVDNILGSIRRGVTTRSIIEKFLWILLFCFYFGTF